MTSPLGIEARVCAWCGRISLGSRWLKAEEAGNESRRAARGKHATHGICPSCLRRELTRNDAVRLSA
ncbi:MAG: hypothetical protein ACRDL2_04505 [Gaiellaceae bacterium]